MIPQLVMRITTGVPINVPNPGDLPIAGVSEAQAALAVLTADPYDLMLHMEQVWDAYDPWAPSVRPAGPARRDLWRQGAFARFVPPGGPPAWDHLGYSYVLENTRAVQVMRRVVHQYRAGESLGVPSVETQRWLDTTEALLFGAANPLAPWLSTSSVRRDPEAVRRNAYWRLFGMDLAFGDDDNRPAAYDKAAASNGGFARLFEELLYELWQAIANITNLSGVNNTDRDRIYRIVEELRFVLRSRRQNQQLAREELAAATALGWVELSLLTNTPVVVDLKAEATSASNRLRRIGERVGMPCHSRSASFFSMASELSLFLRTIESSLLTDATIDALYTDPALVNVSRRVITEWSAATGKDLKSRSRPVETAAPRRLVAVR